MFYTYAHYKPEGGLFYIGKGKRRRAFQLDGRNSHWQNIVNKYGKPHVELLAGWKTEQEALDHERLLIASFRDMGFVLANKSDGGQGSSGVSHIAWNKGISLSEMHKERLSQSAKGRKVWNKGIPISDEQKVKLRNAKLGKPSPRKGVKLSAETIAKMKATRMKNKELRSIQ